MRRSPPNRPAWADARPGGLLRGALALLLLLAPVEVALANGDATSNPLPEGTILSVGLPPFHPEDTTTTEAVQAWCGRAEAQGQKERGTRRGGDLIFAAADVGLAYRVTAGRGGDRYALALAAYPAGDVSRAVVLVRWAQHESVRGNAPKRSSLLERLRPWIDVREPRDADEAELARWQQWAALRRLALPVLVAEEHEANGRLREAADVRSTLAREEARSLPHRGATDLYRRAARLYYRAGLRTESVRAGEDAIKSIAATSPDAERDRARLRFWLLYAQNGILTEDAAPRVDGRWPERFDEDLRAFLRRIEGVEGLATTYLSLASRAYAANRFEKALEIYVLALRDPTIVEQARGNSAIWGGLLMAYAAAMELERFDEAERVLEVVERLAEAPFPAKDAYLVALAKARKDVAERPLREEARRKLAQAKANRATREAARQRSQPARIETGEGASDDDAQDGPHEREDGESSGLDLSLLTLFGAIAGVLVLLLVMNRVARGRR